MKIETTIKAIKTIELEPDDVIHISHIMDLLEKIGWLADTASSGYCLVGNTNGLQIPGAKIAGTCQVLSEMLREKSFTLFRKD